MRSVLYGLLAATALWTGCSASMGSAPMHKDDPLVSQTDALRDEQIRVLYQFDTALGQGDDGCAALCRHHTRICELATRICGISDGNPGHYKARAACDKATETCRETTTRIPEECSCGV